MAKSEKYSISSTFSDAQLAELVQRKKDGKTWDQIRKELNKKYKIEKTTESYRHAYRSYGDLFEIEDKDLFRQKLQEIARTKRASSKAQKENKIIIEGLNQKEDILELISEMVNSIPKTKVKLPKRVKKKNLKPMTKELMLSDIHFGKKTKTFNLEICRKRLRELTQTLIDDIKRDSLNYNVERLIIALLGDIIESEMHGVESLRGLEFGTAKQMAESINSLFLDVLKPLADLGLPIDVPAVCGNHDRIDHKRTYQDPGLNNLTWTIYHTLELLCKQAGYTNMKFTIPEGPYVIVDIYGTKVLLEHGDNIKGTGRQAFETFISKRARQAGVMIDCMRSGHLHEYVMYSRGRAIQNASVCGSDSFSEILGYMSEAGQTINSYVPTNKRPTSFFKSFPVDLEQVK
jgi:hypothetical protein